MRDMIAAIHSEVRRRLYEQGQIPGEVDVCFQPATKEWIDSLTRPTINLFLFEMQENIEKRETNMQTIRGNGAAERRMPPRRIDLYYMVSVLTTEVEDEHELLWRVLSNLMKHQQLPADILPNALGQVDPSITTRIGEREESGRLLDIWTALGTPPHPALCYIVTVPLDLEIAFEAPLVLTRTARYVQAGNSQPAVETGIQIGGIVRDKRGLPLANVTIRIDSSATDGSTTGEDGQFLLRSVREGVVMLNVVRDGSFQKQVQVKVPGNNYEISLDD